MEKSGLKLKACDHRVLNTICLTFTEIVDLMIKALKGIKNLKIKLKPSSFFNRDGLKQLVIYNKEKKILYLPT